MLSSQLALGHEDTQSLPESSSGHVHLKQLVAVEQESQPALQGLQVDPSSQLPWLQDPRQSVPDRTKPALHLVHA